MKSNGQYITEIEHLKFKRGDRYIFNDLSFRAVTGKITALMGPSGTGKSTLLNIISAQLRPSEGMVNVLGQDLSKLSRRDLFSLRKDMGLLFQGGALFTDMNVFENVAFSLREHSHLPETMVRDLVLMMLEAVGLRGAAKLPVSALSGGMARRVALARAVVMGPKLMLYDEPFTGQDPIAQGVLLRLIKQLNDALNLSSIVVSHDVKETASIADYVYIISGGQVVCHGTPDILFEQSDRLVEQFSNGHPDGPIPFHFPADPIAEDILK